MIPCDMLHHITKYECFLMNGIGLFHIAKIRLSKSGNACVFKG